MLEWVIDHAREGWARPDLRKTTYFALFCFLLELGFCCGFFASNSLIISRVGTTELLYVYFGGSLFALALSGSFYFLAGIYSRYRLYPLSFLLIGLSVVGAWGLIKVFPDQNWIYIVVRSFFYAVFVRTNLGFWLIASDAFSNVEARRFFPYIVAAGVGGCVTGGFLVNQSAPIIGTENLILIWGGILILIPPILIHKGLPKGAPEKGTPSLKDMTQRDRAIELKVTHSSNALLSHMTILLFAFWFMYTFIAYGVDYLFNTMVVQNIHDEDLITAYFGKITIFASLVLLLYHLFLASPFIMRHSIGRSLTIMILLIALTSGLLFFYPLLLAATLAWGVQYFFIEFTAAARLNTLFNTIPSDRRGRIKAMTEGFGRPVGTLLLFLIAATASFQLEIDHIRYIIFIGAILFLIYPFLFYRSYFSYLLNCLRSSDPILVTNAIQALGEPHKDKAVGPLLDLLRKSNKLNLKKTIVLALGRIQSREAIEDIVDLFSTDDEALKLSVVRALADYNNTEGTFALLKLIKSKTVTSVEARQDAAIFLTRVAGKKMLPYLLELLLDPDPRIRANAIEAMGFLKSRDLIPIMLPFLKDVHYRIRTNAAIVLYPCRFSRTHARRQALETITELLQSDVREARLAALYAIGMLRLKSHETMLIDLLKSSDKHARLFSAVALARMRRTRFCSTFIALVHDTDTTFAIDAAKRIMHFPSSMRSFLFEKIAELDADQKGLLFSRLDQTAIDFSMEKEAAFGRGDIPFARGSLSLKVDKNPII